MKMDIKGNFVSREQRDKRQEKKQAENKWNQSKVKEEAKEQKNA